MMLTFIPNDRLSGGKLIYLSSDFSFDTINRQTSGVTSLLVNDINIEFSEDYEAVAIWGLCPRSSWRKGSVPKPVSQSGRLRFEGELTPGVSIRVTRSGENWPVTFDPSSEWLHIGQETLAYDQAIEFIEGCIVILREGEIIGLWLHPDYQQ
jgi:hypothetical protein